MRRIDEWQGDHQLGEYASRFVGNDIHFKIPRDLTNQDLEKIGDASLGHRGKLLRAISELNALPAGTFSVVEPPTPPPERRRAAAEPEPLPAVPREAAQPR